jgi:hypothetical protein
VSGTQDYLYYRDIHKMINQSISSGTVLLLFILITVVQFPIPNSNDKFLILFSNLYLILYR